MSATGLDVFDKSLQITNTWLDEIMTVLGPDRKVAWKVLGVVLHLLRDRLPVTLAAHLGSQLPLLVRGLYYDQFQPEKQPSACNTLEELFAEVNKQLAGIRPVNAQDAVRAVFGVISNHVSEGQVVKVKDALPKAIRAAWSEDKGVEAVRG